MSFLEINPYYNLDAIGEGLPFRRAMGGYPVPTFTRNCCLPIDQWAMIQALADRDRISWMEAHRAVVDFAFTLWFQHLSEVNPDLLTDLKDYADAIISNEFEDNAPVLSEYRQFKEEQQNFLERQKKIAYKFGSKG